MKTERRRTFRSFSWIRQKSFIPITVTWRITGVVWLRQLFGADQSNNPIAKMRWRTGSITPQPLHSINSWPALVAQNQRALLLWRSLAILLCQRWRQFSALQSSSPGLSLLGFMRSLIYDNHQFLNNLVTNSWRTWNMLGYLRSGSEADLSWTQPSNQVIL